jgi:hypothetical protein
VTNRLIRITTAFALIAVTDVAAITSLPRCLRRTDFSYRWVGYGLRTISAHRRSAGHLNPRAGHLVNAADGQDLKVRIRFGLLRSGGGVEPSCRRESNPGALWVAS